MYHHFLLFIMYKCKTLICVSSVLIDKVCRTDEWFTNKLLPIAFLTNWKYWSSWLSLDYNSLHCWCVLNLRSVGYRWWLVPCFARAGHICWNESHSTLLNTSAFMTVYYDYKKLFHIIYTYTDNLTIIQTKFTWWSMDKELLIPPMKQT